MKKCITLLNNGRIINCLTFKYVLDTDWCSNQTLVTFFEIIYHTSHIIIASKTNNHILRINLT